MEHRAWPAKNLLGLLAGQALVGDGSGAGHGRPRPRHRPGRRRATDGRVTPGPTSPPGSASPARQHSSGGGGHEHRSHADPTPTSRPDVPVPCQNDRTCQFRARTTGKRGSLAAAPGALANPLTWARAGSGPARNDLRAPRAVSPLRRSSGRARASWRPRARPPRLEGRRRRDRERNVCGASGVDLG